jgi:type I restriction enzyme S subunit
VNGVAFGTTELHVLRSARALEERFLFYVTLSSAFRRLGEGDLYGAGGQKRVSESFVKNLRHPLPPLPEQRAVAAFLDRETARIDGLVAKKEQLIELLQEKRAALITRAVTKGLDPSVPMKDSGVEWLGQIPAHWHVKRLWHLTPPDRRIMYGIVLPGPNLEEGVPIVKGGDVSPERLRLERLNRTSLEIESGYVRSRLRGGDLVFAIRGSIGEVAMVPDELEGANLTQDAARVAHTPAIHGPWLLHALKSAVVFAQLEAGALGATIRGINIRDLKRASLPVPSRQEQETIATFLRRETARTDDLIAKVREAIDRLKELRSALISAAVTGKIDARAA